MDLSICARVGRAFEQWVYVIQLDVNNTKDIHGF